MTILIADARVRAVPLEECGERLVALPGDLVRPTSGAVLVRSSVAVRVREAQALLPDRTHLQVAEGFRSSRSQRRLIDTYAASLRRAHPRLAAGELDRLASRYVAPMDVAPHIAGAAVDLTLTDDTGRELDLGCPLDATPEESAGRCYLAAAGLSAEASANRDLLAGVLGAVGLVNYPTEWWHWSFGDRYWAMATGAVHAVYGPVGEGLAA